MGELQEAKECIKRALLLCPTGNGNDIIHVLPMLHMKCRNWFDDDDVAEESSEDDKDDSWNSVMAPIDPILAKTIRSGVFKLRYVDLKEALKDRGLSVVGPKKDLQSRLLHSLVVDTDSMP